MADKKIIRGVRTDKSTFVAGQEEQLAAVLSADQVTRLIENGSISGDWLPEVKEPETPKGK